MALAVHDALEDAAPQSGRPITAVHLIGGGVANGLFCQLVADVEPPVGCEPR